MMILEYIRNYLYTLDRTRVLLVVSVCDSSLDNLPETLPIFGVSSGERIVAFCSRVIRLLGRLIFSVIFHLKEMEKNKSSEYSYFSRKMQKHQCQDTSMALSLQISVSLGYESRVARLPGYPATLEMELLSKCLNKLHSDSKFTVLRMKTFL